LSTRHKRIATRAATLAVAVATALTLLPGVPAQAKSHRQRQAELQNLIHRKRVQIAAAEKREHDLLARIHNSDTRRSALEGVLRALEGRVGLAKDQLSQLESQLGALQLVLQRKNSELEATLAQLDRQRAQLNARIATIYMTAPFGVTEQLSGASNIAELITANEYGASVIARDQRTVHLIEVTKRKIQAQRAEIAKTQSAIESNRQQTLDRARQVWNVRQQQFRAVAAKSAEIHTRKVLLGQVRREKASYLRALRSYIFESNKIASFLRGHQTGHVIGGIPGFLHWPVPGHRISSPFGWRIHPVYHARSFHTGIDLPNPTGTSVHAARAGNVIYTGWNGAFGNVVIIDHGHRIATMYAHLSRIYSHAGQKVSAGTVVGAVGSTGWSTGPHLHFEVRSNGTPVNPLGWL
jgi:murein DD-endopeptidase MepM/ murein hydrolase activator NlpD